jgi:hypothetical protein
MRPAPTQRIDGRGRFLTPGLVDMHVHLFNNASGRPPNDWAFAPFVANGVTAVREQGLPIVGHVPAATSLLAAARACLHENERLMQGYDACSSVERERLDRRRDLDSTQLVALRDAQEVRTLEAFDQPTCDCVAEALATTGQVQEPTMVLPHSEAGPGTAPERDPRSRYLRADERTRWLRIIESLPPDFAVLAQRRWQVTQAIVAAFHRAGVPLPAGTDAPMPRVYP